MKTLEIVAAARADERDMEIACKAKRIVCLMRESREGIALLKTPSGEQILERLCDISGKGEWHASHIGANL